LIEAVFKVAKFQVNCLPNLELIQFNHSITMSKNLQPEKVGSLPSLFIKSQFGHKPVWPPKDLDLAGKVAVVTGSNTGLGLEAVDQLLSYSLSKVILGVRSVKKGEAAAEELKKKYPKATIEVWQLDMVSYESIQAFVDRVGQLTKLNIVILNAGLASMTLEKCSKTGHEESFQVNYLSTALLAILMLPILKGKSLEPGRLTIVNSGLAVNAAFPNSKEIPLLPSFDDPKNPAWDANTRYACSKLLGHLFLWKLIDFVSADDVVVNLVDPGFCKGTELHKDMPVAVRAIFGTVKVLAGRSIKAGASTYLNAAVVRGKESHGYFIMDWQLRP
jgi:NAD(P)-dependent dehydrogenase (short-subunit alcohol dehydrogenase family)